LRVQKILKQKPTKRQAIYALHGLTMP
jgi:hypothetical protein